MEFFVRSDLVVVGHTEDGEDYLAPSYYVVAEDEHGARWAHGFQFCAARQVEHFEGWSFVAVETAEADAEALCEKIAAAGNINLEHWMALPAAYGSAAHDELELMEWEKKSEAR